MERTLGSYFSVPGCGIRASTNRYPFFGVGDAFGSSSSISTDCYGSRSLSDSTRYGLATNTFCILSNGTLTPS